MPRILILADHRWRDLPGLVAVRVELEKLSESNDVLICDIHLFSRVVDLFKPHIVAVNHLHDRKRNKIVDTVRRRGGLCVVLPSEGRPNTEAQMEWAARRFDTSLCDLYCSWSEEFNKNLPGSVNGVVTGAPRMDFYREPLSKLILARDEVTSLYSLDSSRPIVTVASSFPQAKFADTRSYFLVHDWANLGVSTIPGREDPVEFAKAEKQSFLRFQAWIQLLAREHPEFQIVVKPHPAEDMRYWERFCDSIGAKLMLTDYAWNLLALSDVHVARTACMTLAEAWMMGKPTVQCITGNDTFAGANSDTLSIGEKAFSPDEFITAIDKCLKTASVDIPNWYLDKWLWPHQASSESAVAIANLLEQRKPQTHDEPTAKDRLKLYQIMEMHNRNWAVPGADHVGQFAKAVTPDAVGQWYRLVGGILN